MLSGSSGDAIYNVTLHIVRGLFCTIIEACNTLRRGCPALGRATPRRCQSVTSASSVVVRCAKRKRKLVSVWVQPLGYQSALTVVVVVVVIVVVCSGVVVVHIYLLVVACVITSSVCGTFDQAGSTKHKTVSSDQTRCCCSTVLPKRVTQTNVWSFGVTIKVTTNNRRVSAVMQLIFPM